MRALRYGVALVVVVDFLVAVVQMQQAIIERASFRPPSVTTFGQYAITMTSKTADDLDLFVRDPHGEVAWYGSLQSATMSLEHDTIPGVTDPVSVGEHELTVIREATPGEYTANVLFYRGSATAHVTVDLWDLRGWGKRVILSRTFDVRNQGAQTTAFRWRLNTSGNYVGHNLLPANIAATPPPA
jgi:hypothetical protein